MALFPFIALLLFVTISNNVVVAPKPAPPAPATGIQNTFSNKITYLYISKTNNNQCYKYFSRITRIYIADFIFIYKHNLVELLTVHNLILSSLLFKDTI